MDNIQTYREAAKRILSESNKRTPVCWQFVCHVRGDRGLETPAMEDIVADQNMEQVTSDNQRLLISRPRDWSVVLFELRKLDWHAGIVLPGRKTFIHLRRKTGIEITKLSDKFWSKTCRGYYDNR